VESSRRNNVYLAPFWTVVDGFGFLASLTGKIVLSSFDSIEKNSICIPPIGSRYPRPWNLGDAYLSSTSFEEVEECIEFAKSEKERPFSHKLLDVFLHPQVNFKVGQGDIDSLTEEKIDLVKKVEKGVFGAQLGFTSYYLHKAIVKKCECSALTLLMCSVMLMVTFPKSY
jgi:hypothetical protein